MNKELEQLRKLLSYKPDKTDWWGEERELIALEINDCLNNIEEALKDYDYLKRVNKDLEEVKEKLINERMENVKKLAAFEIVKPFLLANDYLYLCRIGANNVTPEEYNLLKEVLLNETEHNQK